MFISEDEGGIGKMGGFDSPYELVGRVRIPDDGRWKIRGIIQQAIDYDRYIVTVGPKSGAVSIWWRVTAKGAQWESYLKDANYLRRRYRAKKNNIKTSSRYLLSIHKMPQVFENARRWKQWRSARAYGFRLSAPTIRVLRYIHFICIIAAL